jgi:hypothetical protein
MSELFNRVLRESWGTSKTSSEAVDDKELRKEQSSNRRDMIGYIMLNTINCLDFDWDRIDAKNEWKRGVSLSHLIQREWPGTEHDQAVEAVGEGTKSLIELIHKLITREEIIKFLKSWKREEYNKPSLPSTKKWNPINEDGTNIIQED